MRGAGWREWWPAPWSWRSACLRRSVVLAPQDTGPVRARGLGNPVWSVLRAEAHLCSRLVSCTLDPPL